MQSEANLQLLIRKTKCFFAQLVQKRYSCTINELLVPLPRLAYCISNLPNKLCFAKILCQVFGLLVPILEIEYLVEF